jgi:acyl-CoA thioesterase FadM
VLLLFRFLLAMFEGMFRRHIGALDESRIRFTALPTDCDLNFHVNSGRYLSFMDVARMELLARMRAVRPLLRRGWRPVMGGCVIRFRRSVLPFQRFDVRTRVLGWDEKWFYFEHVIERNGQFYGVGHVRTLIRSRTNNIPPPEVLELLGESGLQAPPLPDFVLRWRDAENAR